MEKPNQQSLFIDRATANTTASILPCPPNFSLLFKQSTGLTPHQYVIKIRVDRAKYLLLQGKNSIADIAQIVGFANQSHLNLHFKRLVGVTPKQFSQK